MGAGQVGGAMRTKFAPDQKPDLQLFIMPLSVDKPGDHCTNIQVLPVPYGNVIQAPVEKSKLPLQTQMRVQELSLIIFVKSLTKKP